MKKVIDGALVKFTFDDNVPELVFDCNSMSEANMDYSIPFGMCHRLGDMAAIPRKDGLVVTEQMRHDAVKEGMVHYANKEQVEWNMKQSARAAPQNPTILAIAAKLGVSYVEAEAEIQRRMLEELAA